MSGATESRPAGLLSSKRLVADLLAPRPAVYWTDFLLSASIGWTAFTLAVVLPWSGPGVLALPVAVLALYRAALFIHELTHLKSGSIPGFSLAWNLLLGIPMLVPSYLYVGVHNDHHRRTTYGTPLDPEYRPLARGSRAGVIVFLLEPWIAPLLLFLRHLVLAPLSWCIPPLRRFVVRRASGLVINPLYARRPPAASERRRMIVLEAGCLAAWSALLLGVFTGAVPVAAPLTWYLVASLVLLINQVRTLGAHLYRNDGGLMDVADQVLDSVSIEGRFWTELWAPVGLRYHALHHYLPDLPYHSLGAAHRRLMAALPPDAPYRRAVKPGLMPVLRSLWNSPLRNEGLPGMLPAGGRFRSACRLLPRWRRPSPMLIPFHRLLITVGILFGGYFSYRMYLEHGRTGSGAHLGAAIGASLATLGLLVYLPRIRGGSRHR